MYLTRHQTSQGPRWAVNDRFLPPSFTLGLLLENPRGSIVGLLDTLASEEPAEGTLLPPLEPKHEVWACGVTYLRSREAREAESQAGDVYTMVYNAERPEIFFKGTARVCVGPGEVIGIRSDSHFTAPEPELAVILGNEGRVIGYTLANDVSAWDIERENPLYLPQSKIYTGCCSLGPMIVTTDQLPDPYSLEISCTITRGDKTIFSGTTSTSRLARRIDGMVNFLLRSNPVPAGSVLLTGTGIIITQETALVPGDIVSIKIPEIGELSNVASLV